MKTTILMLSFLSLTQTAYAKCNTENIVIMRESGFGISFGGGGSKSGFQDKNTVNVPITINGQQACFKKSTSFNMKSEKKKEKPEENSITLTPMKTEFENIPSPHQKQYIFVEKADNKMLTRFHVMNFVCSGETPLSIEATSDSVLKIMSDSSKIDVGVHMTFATGAAAENINRARKGVSYSQETFDFFTKIYKTKTVNEINSERPCCTEYNAPSILTDTSIRAFSGVERAIASSFTTMNSDVPNGCSNDFAETMKNYQFENFEANESLKDYKVKKKWFSDSLIFEW